MNSKIKKCGLISIIGFPNVGKSTLLNRLVNEKISIISSKSQTTKIAVKGVLNKEECQIIFIDTPGFLKPKSYLDKEMTRSILHSLEVSDINLVIIDAKKIKSFEYINLFNLIKGHKKNVLVINKIDLIKKIKLLDIVKNLNADFEFFSTFMISALRNKGLNKLLKNIMQNIPKRDWEYDKKVITDQKLDFVLSEITREKIFQLLNKELPYVVKIETKIKKKNSLYKIYQTIYVKKDSQKPILIGKNGEKIKEIGIRARSDMEKKLGQKIYLDILISLDKRNNK